MRQAFWLLLVVVGACEPVVRIDPIQGLRDAGPAAGDDAGTTAGDDAGRVEDAGTSAVWTCDVAYLGTDDGCDCGCGAFDPDCADRSAVSCDFCGDIGSCNESSGACPGLIRPDDNTQCQAPRCGDGAISIDEQCDPPDGVYCDLDCLVFTSEPDCDDLNDNDIDGYFDCEDPDCSATSICDPGTGAVGAPCQANSDCAADDRDPLCFKEQVAGWPGGGCSEFCDLVADDCPGGAQCIDNGLPSGHGVCYAGCDVDEDCRDGFTCTRALGRKGVCTGACTDSMQCTTTHYCGDGQCTATPICGDFWVAGGEECDPPVAGECTNDCQRIPRCGDFVLDPGELCDPPGAGACGPSCTFEQAECGDGTTTFPEECDPPDGALCDEHCRRAAPAAWFCTPSFFGDELCDCGCGSVDVDCPDATAASCDFCDPCAITGCEEVVRPDDNAHCLVDNCGDGQIDIGEECDPPNGGSCSDDCHRVAICGDFFVDAPETCDPPQEGVCDPACRVIPSICGDGVLGVGEQCDPPDGAVCNGACQVVLSEAWTCEPAYFDDGFFCDCGCGLFDPDCFDHTVSSCHFCDDPGACAVLEGCSAVIADDNAVCAPPVCGDGVLGPGEECEPPGTSTCDDACLRPVPAGWTCTHGFFDADDGCDCGCGAPDPDCAPDAGASACDYCGLAGSCNGPRGCPGVIDPNDTASCTPTVCGDAVVAGAEQCDPPDDAGCSAACAHVVRCGDGVVEIGEQCDPPDGVRCGAACTLAPLVCGDGSVVPPEQCDPPDDAGCASTCAYVAAPASWTCDPRYFDDGALCDCGCGVVDPDCADATASSCHFCGLNGACSDGACPSTVNAANNSACL